MPRHRKQKFDELIFSVLMLAPFWLGPLLAAAVYGFLHFGWPVLFGADPAVSLVRRLGPVAAPWIGLAILMLWILAEARKWRTRQLLEAQTGFSSLRKMSWRDFERLVGEAYRRQGYSVEETGTGSDDGDIDLVLNGHGETVLVQCKHWRTQRVGVALVRELYGVLASRRADRAVLVTCGRSTEDACEFAQGKPLQLIYGEELLQLVRAVQPTESPLPHDAFKERRPRGILPSVREQHGVKNLPTGPWRRFTVLGVQPISALALHSAS